MTMHKIIRVLGLSSVLLIGLSLPFQSSMAVDYRSGDEVQLNGEFDDNIFASGGFVRADLRSSDDVFIAGGEVLCKSEVKENLFVAGGTLEIEASRADTGAIAGGSISFSQSVFRELLTAGGSIRIEDTEVRDDLVVGAGNLRIGKDVKVGGSSTLAGGNVRLDGHFAGNVRVYAGQLHLGSSAVIDGDLAYRADQVNIHSGAKITGKTVILPKLEDKGEYKVLGFFGGILLFLGTLLLAPIVMTFTPQLAAQSRQEIRSRFLPTLGKGVLVAILTPVVIGLLIPSLVGVPLGMLLFLAFAMALILSWAVGIFVIGDQLRAWVRKKDAYSMPTARSQFGWTLLGGAVFYIIFLIPILGFVFVLLMILLGLGAVFASVQKYLLKIH